MRSASRGSPQTRIARRGRLVLYLLLFSLPLYGFSAALAAWLGIQHRHRPVLAAPEISGLQDLRRMAVGPGQVVPVHRHAFFQRHHHLQPDRSVVALGADPRQAPASDALLISGMAALAPPGANDWEVRAPAAMSVGWPPAGACRFTTRTAGPPERPPKAQSS